MAEKKYFANINLNLNTLIAAKIYPLSSSSRLSLTLGSGDKGIAVFDTTDSQLYFWNGSVWVLAVQPVSGAVNYKGTYGSLVTAPSPSANGDMYYMTVSGTLVWAGITFSPSADVQIGDFVIRRDATHWDVVQGNSIPATEAVAGIILIATQVKTDGGTDDASAVTPLKLTTFIANKAITKKYYQQSITLVATTPLTITHGLGLTNKDAFVIRVADSTGATISVNSESVDANNLTITSTINLSNVKVAIIG